MILSLRSFRLERRPGQGPTDFKLRRRAPLYVASRASLASRPAMWRAFRIQGFNIVSTWIDSGAPAEARDWRPDFECYVTRPANQADLWIRVVEEIRGARGIVLYAEPDDFPLQGALVEVGIALGFCKPITLCLPGVQVDQESFRPIGAWINHPLVVRIDDIARAMARAEMRCA